MQKATELILFVGFLQMRDYILNPAFTIKETQGKRSDVTVSSESKILSDS
jgi:hypothetical protein